MFSIDSIGDLRALPQQGTLYEFEEIQTLGAPHLRCFDAPFGRSYLPLHFGLVFSKPFPASPVPLLSREGHRPLVAYRVEVKQRTKAAPQTHLVFHKVSQVLGANPRCANAGGDPVLGYLRWLRRLKQGNIAGVFGVGFRHLSGNGQLPLHIARQVLVHRLKESGLGVLDNLVGNALSHGIDIRISQPRHIFKVGIPELVEGHRQGIMVALRPVRPRGYAGDVFGEDVRDPGYFTSIRIVLFKGDNPCCICKLSKYC